MYTELFHVLTRPVLIRSDLYFPTSTGHHYIVQTNGVPQRTTSLYNAHTDG